MLGRVMTSVSSNIPAVLSSTFSISVDPFLSGSDNFGLPKRLLCPAASIKAPIIRLACECVIGF